MFLPFFIFQQDMLEILGCKFVQLPEAFFYFLVLCLLRCTLCFFEGDLIVIGQPADGFYKGELFIFLYECDHISATPATEAFIDAFAGRDGKRRRFLVVERAIGNIVGAPLFQAHKLPDNLYDVCTVQYFLHGCLGDHTAKILRYALFLENG